MISFGGSPPQTLTARARILIVDDHEDSRIVTRMVLEHAGYVVDEAASGGRGLALAIANQPDIAIVDIIMPEFDGLELTRRLRAHPRTSGTRIIAVTAMARPTLPHEAMLAGCDAFLMKPVSIAALRVLVVNQLLRSNGTSSQCARA